MLVGLFGFTLLILALFFFGVHIAVEVALHFDIVFFFFVCVFILVLFLSFVALNLLFEFDFIAHILGAFMGFTLADTHSISNFLCPTLFPVFLLLLLHAKSILLQIEGNTGNQIANFHQRHQLIFIVNLSIFVA